ncbi:hypothetical protein [Alkalicoccus luteus]|uniref:Uracil DNA glycosylase superfamily protein n=1 Tax=Alkalicoccus luteus TaxID=1237094 RepID=A0A969TTU7_9BACI|nr:hypothetical protein [Alkalicoccus luteus]NJP38033.1 hypothetical protein [Alkalicoccus luteus]
METTIMQQAAQLQDKLAAAYPDLLLPQAVPLLWLGPVRPVLTIGVNPSPRDFDNEDRFPRKKNDQKAVDWAKTEAEAAMRQLNDYFLSGDVYTNWFGKKNGAKMEGFMNGAGHSYYGDHASVYHMDYVPFATKKRMGATGLKEELFQLEDMRTLFQQRLTWLRPRQIWVFGDDVKRALPEVEHGPVQLVPGYPAVSFASGSVCDCPAVFVHAKPGEQFLGLGSATDSHGRHHGSYGSRSSLREIGAIISREIEGLG